MFVAVYTHLVPGICYYYVPASLCCTYECTLKADPHMAKLDTCQTAAAAAAAAAATQITTHKPTNYLREAIVIRTHDVPKNPHIPLFLHTILRPD